MMGLRLTLLVKWGTEMISLVSIFRQWNNLKWTAWWLGDGKNSENPNQRDIKRSTKSKIAQNIPAPVYTHWCEINVYTIKYYQVSPILFLFTSQLLGSRYSLYQEMQREFACHIDWPFCLTTISLVTARKFHSVPGRGWQCLVCSIMAPL